MRDERLAEAEELFQRAWALDAALADLLRRRTGEPGPPNRGTLASYARCADLLHGTGFATTLRTLVDPDGLFRRVRESQAPLADTIARTIECFREAHRLVADFAALQKRLPDPGISREGRLPPDWSEFHRYAVHVSALEAVIRFGLSLATMDASMRQDSDAARALSTPPGKERT